LGVAKDHYGDTGFGIQGLEDGQAGFHRDVLGLIAGAVADERVAGEQATVALAREKADVHCPGIFAQAVGEELDPLLPGNGDVVIADFRDDFLGFLIVKHRCLQRLLSEAS
jgi:hypothetical protein